MHSGNLTQLLVPIIILYFFVRWLTSQTPAARKKRRLAQLAQEEVARQRALEAEEKKRVHAQNKAETTALREREISKSMPTHIAAAFSQFKADQLHGKASFGSMHEFSPLTCFGYRVGKSQGVPKNRRHEIVYYTWHANLSDIIPSDYAREWGQPGTYYRYQKIIGHLTRLARQRAGRFNYEVAVEEWEADIRWLEETHGTLARRYRDFGYAK